MPVIHKRALAEQDLINIWLYTCHKWAQRKLNSILMILRMRWLY